jgi:hypothetical protein
LKTLSISSSHCRLVPRAEFEEEREKRKC